MIYKLSVFQMLGYGNVPQPTPQSAAHERNVTQDCDLDSSSVKAPHTSGLGVFIWSENHIT